MKAVASPDTPGTGALRRAIPVFGPAMVRPEVRALSADAVLLECLQRSPRHARVHSVFDRVLNVDAGGDRLLTLAHREADDGPDTVVVDFDSWAVLDLAPGADVFLSRRRIELGNVLAVVLEQARPWQGRLPSYAPEETNLRANLLVAQVHLERHGKGIGRRRSAGEVVTGLDQLLVNAFHCNTKGLCRALAHGDESQAIAHIIELVGLGPGLTPSGDDFLVGLLAALNIPGSPRHACRRIGVRIVECAARQTNLISAAALRHTANGRVRASVVGLCDALMYAGPTRMLKALDTVLRIGSSSGTDIALGVLAGFRLHLGFEDSIQLLRDPHDASGDVHGS